MSNFELIPVGNYRARAIETSFGHTKNGNEELTIKLSITEGEYEGRHVWARLYFTEKTTERSIESLKYMGFEGDFIDLCESLTDASTMLPAECIAVVEHSEYQGKTSAKVAWINSLYGKGGGAMKPAANPLDTAGKRAFAARMNALSGKPASRPIGGGPGLAARTSSDGHKAQRTARPAPGPELGHDGHALGGDDDIPFLPLPHANTRPRCLSANRERGARAREEVAMSWYLILTARIELAWLALARWVGA